jgi:hypothetical protein
VDPGPAGASPDGGGERRRRLPQPRDGPEHGDGGRASEVVEMVRWMEGDREGGEWVKKFFRFFIRAGPLAESEI